MVALSTLLNVLKALFLHLFCLMCIQRFLRLLNVKTQNLLDYVA